MSNQSSSEYGDLKSYSSVAWPEWPEKD